MEKRDALKVWTILLAILTFSLSLLGTFLVRSGVLTSVHAFAVDPTRGVFILAILILFIGGSLALFAWRAPLLRQGGLFAPVSREGALVVNNLFLATGCATVFVGTLYPLALEALDGRQDLGRRAVLQLHLRADRGAASRSSCPSARRWPGSAATCWARRSGCSRPSGSRSRSRSALLAVTTGGPVAAPLGDRARRLPGRSAPLTEIVTRAWGRGVDAGGSLCAAPPACRARPGARRSRMPASASR